MSSMQAWKVIPTTMIIAILNEVRNRILSFVLEIEAENPEAGEAALNSTPVSQEKIQQIFNTIINGNIQNVATGSYDFNQNADNTDLNGELFQNLLDALNLIQEKETKEEFSAVIKEMQATQGTSEFKDKYLAFTSLLSNHITIFQYIAAYLPALTALNI